MPEDIERHRLDVFGHDERPPAQVRVRAGSLRKVDRGAR